MKNKNNNNQQKGTYSKKKQYTGYLSFFAKVMLIAVIPIVIVDVLISFLFNGSAEWLVWVVTAVGLIIAGVIGLKLQEKKDKIEREEQLKSKKKNGKYVLSKDDIDIFSK